MDVRLPQLTEGADSGTVVNVLVKEGQKVQQGETLLELENQKAVAPIPSTVSGTVTKIHVKQGDVLSVGQVLVSVTEESGSAESAPSTLRQAQGERSSVAVSAPREPSDQVVAYEYRSASGAPPPASPAVRKLAMELGLDLRKVRGSERGGRITTADLRAYITQLQSRAQVGGAAAPLKKIDFEQWGPVRREPFSPLRRAIAQAMVRSWTTIPHVTQFDDVEVGDLLKRIERFAPSYEKQNSRLTLTTVLIRALVPVLKQYPVFNASLDEFSSEVVFKEAIHMGIAVDTPAGLIVPVLRNVEKKSLLELGRELPDLVERTRQRKASPQELQGGSFTISNQGGIGGRHFTPIIHAPEVAILGVGRAARGILPLALSYDHRVIDGADAARFITVLGEKIRNFPEQEIKI